MVGGQSPQGGPSANTQPRQSVDGYHWAAGFGGQGADRGAMRPRLATPTRLAEPPRTRLRVVSLYGLHPVDLQSTAAVPRLHAQLLTLLAGAHPEWDFLAISPQARPLPNVATVGVGVPPSARARARSV